jgi:DNA polymerase-4
VRDPDEWPHVYAHLDMDAFYVSCELQRRPELVGKPVVVAGSGPRAVVTTASYEARRFGVFSATPAARARRSCPDAIFVPPDFDHYRQRSQEVMEVLRGQVDTVEVVGLDEAYLDLTGFERPNAAGRRVKAAVTERTGLGCSIGIGPSKLVAKVASDADKPDGFLSLTAAEARERFGAASPRLVPGIGPKTLQRLESRGITRLDQLAERSDAELSELFGARLGPHLGSLARFEDERELETVRVRKSESRETTFDSDLRGLDAMEPELMRLADQLCDDLVRHRRSGRTVRLKVRLDDFSIHTRARTLPAAVNDPETIRAVALELLRALDPQRPVRLLGVGVAGMESRPEPADQLQLLG